MAALRWVGFALVAAALAVLPFAVWVSGRWGIISAMAGLVGLVLLVAGLAGNRRADR